MTSTLIMKGFLVQYLICAGVCVYEKNFPRALYWFAAALLTISILVGMK